MERFFFIIEMIYRVVLVTKTKLRFVFVAALIKHRTPSFMTGIGELYIKFRAVCVVYGLFSNLNAN